MRSLMVRKPTLLSSTALHCWRKLAQALAQTCAKEHLLIQIQPKAPILLQGGGVAYHIVSTALTRKPRHLQPLHMPPARLSCVTIMSISREGVRIPTATLPTLPLNLVGLPTGSSWLSFPPSQFRRHLFFTQLRKPRPDRCQSRLLHLLLHTLNDCPALFSLQFSCHKLSTHRADCSLSEM